MRKARLLIAVLVVFAVFISCSGAVFAKEGAGFSAQVEMWMPTLTGSINPSGYTIDLRDDLNLGKYNPLGLGVGYNFDPNHRVLFNYMHFNNEGSNILAKPFIYQGVTFNTGGRIDSVLKTSLIDGRYEWLLGRNDTGELNLNAGLRSITMTSKVSNIGGRAAEQNISLLEPLIGLGFKQELAYKLSLVGDFTYAGWSRKGSSVSNSDYRFGLNWEFGEGWGLDAGYRSMWLYGKDDNSNNLNIRYEGPNILLKFAR